MEQIGTVLWEYTANSEAELSLKAGDTVVVEENDQDGWTTVIYNGAKGYFPTSYLEIKTATPTIAPPKPSVPPPKPVVRSPSSPKDPKDVKANKELQKKTLESITGDVKKTKKIESLLKENEDTIKKEIPDLFKAIQKWQDSQKVAQESTSKLLSELKKFGEKHKSSPPSAYFLSCTELFSTAVDERAKFLEQVATLATTPSDIEIETKALSAKEKRIAEFNKKNEIHLKKEVDRFLKAEIPDDQSLTAIQEVVVVAKDIDAARDNVIAQLEYQHARSLYSAATQISQILSGYLNYWASGTQKFGDKYKVSNPPQTPLITWETFEPKSIVLPSAPTLAPSTSGNKDRRGSNAVALAIGDPVPISAPNAVATKANRLSLAPGAKIAPPPPPSTPKVVVALPPGWSELTAENGDKYYWNENTNETSWIDPRNAK